MPRIDVMHGTCDVDLYGRYDRVDHAIELYPDTGDRWDALDTLVHELAHAWAPVERRHHGPKWRRTFCDMFRWLLGFEFDAEDALRRHDTVMAMLKPRMRSSIAGSGRGAIRLAKLADIEFTHSLAETKPDTHITEPDIGCLDIHVVVPRRILGSRWGARELHRVRVDMT